jgi:ABC-type phosphate transport system substrate-binding protein
MFSALRLILSSSLMMKIAHNTFVTLCGVLLLSALLGFVPGRVALADVVVVTSAQSGVERLSPNDVTDIFLGRYRKLPSGESAVPIDQPAGSSLKAAFYRQLVNKEPAEINAYWARLYFSGKTSPPLQAASPAEVLSLLASTPGAIAYIERKQLDARFRVVLDLAP